MKIKLISFILFGALVLAACAPAAAVEEVVEPVVEEAMPAAEEEMAVEESQSEEMDSSMAEEVSFSEDIWPVIEMYALDAHGGSGGVFLESYEDILGYVVPGNPEESMLYKALTADGMPVMPPSGKLPDETIQLFYDWIAQGAKNN